MGESSKPEMLTIKILLAESGAIIRLDMALDSRRATQNGLGQGYRHA